MKNKPILLMIIILITLLIITISCVSNPAEPDTDTGEGTILTETVYAASLEGNLLDISTNQEITIYLPPEYNNSDSSFPVVYYMHGYGGDHTELLYFCNKRTIDKFMNTDASRQFIIVGVNSSKPGSGYYNSGYFFVNSEAAGNWETFFINELIPYIDSNFRTLANVESRGITGESMGGFGSIYNGLRHPDKFSCLFSLSPGLFADDGLENAMPTWDMGIKRAYGVSFAPDTSNPPYYTNIPSDADINNMTPDAQKWQNGFGGIEEKISEYLANPDKLKAIQIEYGIFDSYTWIPDGCEYIHSLFIDKNIEHTFNKFSGGHGDKIAERLREHMLPFFREQLIF